MEFPHFPSPTTETKDRKSRKESLFVAIFADGRTENFFRLTLLLSAHIQLLHNVTTRTLHHHHTKIICFSIETSSTYIMPYQSISTLGALHAASSIS
jgi:hypothetical protein